MVDEETQDVAAGPAGARSIATLGPIPASSKAKLPRRGARRRRAAARRGRGGGSRPRSAPAGQTRPHWRSCFRGRRARRPDRLRACRRRRRIYFLASKADLAEDADRLAALESQAQSENAALDAEAKRESAAVANLDKRMSALEASASASGAAELDKRVARWRRQTPRTRPTSPPLPRPPGAWRRRSRTCEPTSTPRAAKFPASRRGSPSWRPGLRMAKAPDLSALAARVDKIEAALAAPKSETRVASEKPAAADNAAAIAIIAGADGR